MARKNLNIYYEHNSFSKEQIYLKNVDDNGIPFMGDSKKYIFLMEIDSNNMLLNIKLNNIRLQTIRVAYQSAFGLSEAITIGDTPGIYPGFYWENHEIMTGLNLIDTNPLGSHSKIYPIKYGTLNYSQDQYNHNQVFYITIND